MSSPFPLCHVKAHKRDVNPSLNYHPGFICLPAPIHLPAINWRCINSCTLSNLSSDCKKGRYNLKTRYCPSSKSVLIHTSQNGHIHRFVYFSHFNGWDLGGQFGWVGSISPPHTTFYPPWNTHTWNTHTWNTHTWNTHTWNTNTWNTHTWYTHTYKNPPILQNSHSIMC